MTTPIIVVADDLSGALDSAAPFASRGLHVRVALGVASIAEAVAARPDVLAISTRSRALPAPLAAQRVEAAWAAAKALSPRLVMKKVDSRLKGEIAAEAAALLAASGRTFAIACPAVPEQGREVTRGRLTGRGVAVPIPVRDLLGHLPCECHDAADDADLRAIARAILAAPDRTVAIGARGLAAALADLVAGPPSADQALAPALPMVIAIGSSDPITHAQVERLKLDWPQVPEVPVPAAVPVNPRDPIVLMRTRWQPGSDAAALVRRLGQEAAAMAWTVSARTIFCSGGDTAAAVMDAFGARQLVAEYELCAGVAVARIEGTDGVRLITKSGGFGDPGVLSRIAGEAIAARGQVMA